MRQLGCAAPRCLEGRSGHVFQWHLNPDISTFTQAPRACVSGDIRPFPLVTPHLKHHDPRGKNQGFTNCRMRHDLLSLSVCFPYVHKCDSLWRRRARFSIAHPKVKYPHKNSSEQASLLSLPSNSPSPRWYQSPPSHPPQSLRPTF